MNSISIGMKIFLSVFTVIFLPVFCFRAWEDYKSRKIRNMDEKKVGIPRFLKILLYIKTNELQISLIVYRMFILLYLITLPIYIVLALYLFEVIVMNPITLKALLWIVGGGLMAPIMGLLYKERFLILHTTDMQP